jgi:membrane protein YqaA with SNARE-associated domain
MSSFFQSFFHLFLNPVGLVVLAALDSSMFFFLPVAVDGAVVILAARHAATFWVYPPLATAGSVIGSAVTFWMGRKIGEKSIEHWVSSNALRKVRNKIKDKGAIALALPAILPPPFPLTPFVLACGALKVRRKTFFAALGVLRLLRYGVVALLGWIYGRRVLAILDSELFKIAIAVFVILALAGTAVTVVKIMQRATRRTA